ncbi:hypothetical protein [Anaerolactibacter massiliensis]|uniref:hypothetical protein n=1 Tax=Anaerolactibacter massiliensis TaxID=2044573 RepID=UPI000CF93F7B|nr:hypothetical protein [Anaerolactibacter massiliensis]
MFGKEKETKEEKQARKMQELMERYGLGDVSPEYSDAVQKIANELAGTKLMETGMTLSMGAKPEDALPVYYLRTIMEQNFIIIRELDALQKK